MIKVNIYTDGSSRGNPGRGGYGCIIQYTDSKYVTDAFNKNWISGWKRRGWRKGNGERVKNIDLWERLLSAIKDGGHEVTFVWIKGHNGHPLNERCDQLATKAADGDDVIEDENYGGN